MTGRRRGSSRLGAGRTGQRGPYAGRVAMWSTTLHRWEVWYHSAPIAHASTVEAVLAAYPDCLIPDSQVARRDRDLEQPRPTEGTTR